MPRRFSALWQGGQFTINFVTQNLPARWHRADAVDADNDSIPDDIDPYLNDAGNPTLQAGQFYWAGGSFRIDGQMNTFAGGVFTGMDGDQDGDGLPDHFDAWPADPSNNSAWWPGGTFTISGQSETLAGQWHHANSGDQDSDTIPDDLDPFPSDPNNGTVVPAYWAGGTFIIDGQSVPFAGQNYTGDFIDPDGDGLPNFADPYPSDGTNNSFNWSGGEFTINDIFVRFGPGWYAGSSTDSNNNNLPDCLDDWFVDPSTHGQFQQWTGGTFTCDGQPRTWPALKYYASALNDADLDTIPDEIDPYPADANNHSGFIWPAEQMTLLYGNVQTTFNPTPYGGDFVDADTDTIPDQAETNDYVNDEWNGNDTDGDLIPDHVEVQYPTLLDRTNASDATNLRPADGITYLRLYQYNVEAATQSTPLAAVALDQPFPARDSDIDTMPDVYELRYMLAPFDRLDAVESPAGDLVFNFEKAAHADDPATPISPENYTAYTGQTHADALSHHNNAQSNAENDWDGDKVSNIDELFVFGTNARNVSLRPDDATIIWAITGTHLLSASTGIHFLYLVTPCICSNADCPHSITCNSTDHSAGCVCTYPPSCICSNNSTCPHNSTCVCTGNCFPPPPTCNCGGNICPITGCFCNGNSGNCTWTANCDCTSLGCPGKILGGFCGTGGPFCTCGGSTGCLCLKSGCPTSTCTCGGTATCGGGPGFCPGCVNMNCVSSGCSCAGSGTCPSPPPPCNCGMGTCPGTTIANDGACSHFNAGTCAGCCYCGHSGCPGGYCGNAGQGTGSCTCNTYCNGNCGTTGCPGTGCMCAYAGNCVPAPCGGNGGIPCGATNGVVSCPGAGCTCGGLSSLNSLSSPGSCVPPPPTVEVSVVNRDDPKKTWADAQTSSGGTVYAGKESGDMISWKLSGPDSGTFTWKATGPIGEVINGPTGSGKNEWKFADGDSDTGNDWLKWKPGKYKIKCTVQTSGGSSFDIDLDQEVGWRTESWMVIGQIVQTHTHDGDAPAVIQYNGGLDLSSPVVFYRRAVVNDIQGWLLTLDPTTNLIREAIALTLLPITGKLTEAWFGNWAMVVPHALTPTGPFTSSSPSYLGAVTEPHRLWMMQHLFNISYDRPSVPATITESALDGILQDQQYRILHRYQAKFEVATGAIKSGSFTALSPLGDQGKTKINIGVEAGEFNPVWDNPAWVYNLTSDEPELSPKSNKDGKVSADAHAISSYWSARVGAHGRNANWRLMGMDAPWIFSEIIFEMMPDGTVDTRLRTSVDIAWKDGNVTSGTKQFNNLNIYKRTVTALQREVKYERQGLLEMEGKLEPFVKSASGVWPEPPLSPEIQ